MQNTQAIPPDVKAVMTDVIVWMATSRRMLDEVIDQMPLYLLQKTQAGAKLAALAVRLQKVSDDKPQHWPDEGSHEQQMDHLMHHVDMPLEALEDAQKTIKAVLKQQVRQRARVRLMLLERDVAETIKMYPFARESEA